MQDLTPRLARRDPETRFSLASARSMLLILRTLSPGADTFPPGVTDPRRWKTSSALINHVVGLVYPLGQFPEVLLRTLSDAPNGGVKRVGRDYWVRTNLKTKCSKIRHSELNYSFVLVSLSVDGRDAGVQHGLEKVHGHA